MFTPDWLMTTPKTPGWGLRILNVRNTAGIPEALILPPDHEAPRPRHLRTHHPHHQMTANLNEFPKMTPEATHAFFAAEYAWNDVRFGDALTPKECQRRVLSAFLREAVFQAFPGYRHTPSSLHSLLEMADNLHTPPPPSPSPTLDEACKADLDDLTGRAVVRLFLRSLKKKGQP